jgi:hypothetical protein
VTRLNKILIGLLVVQAVLAAIVLLRDDDTALAAQRPIVAGLDPKLVTKIAVYDKDAEAPGLELSKTDAGWQLASHFGHPASAEKVDELLTKIAALRTRGPIATTALRLDQLRVGDKAFERKLVFTTPKGDVTLLVGTSAGGRSNAVRVGGTPGAHGVTTLSSWAVDPAPSRWIETSYFEVDRERIVRVVIQAPSGAVELDRGATGWQLTAAGQPVALAPGEQLDTAAVETIVGAVARMTVFEPADPARDASAPTATISIWVTPEDPAGPAASPDQRVADHTIDVVLDGENYWVRERGRPTAGKLGKHGLASVVEATRAKLVKTATPSPSPKPAAPKPGAPQPGAPKPLAPKPATQPPAPG